MDEQAERPDVAVIIAVRNGVHVIGRAIESVVRQRGCSVEILIVDALSDDGTDAVVRSFAGDIATFIREADDGISDAWNKALDVTRSDWCVFLGCDDFLLGDEALASLLAVARADDSRPVLVHGGVIRRGGERDYLRHPAPDGAYEYVAGGKMLPHQGILHDVAALRKSGGFDTSFRIACDHDAFVRVAGAGRVVRFDGVVAVMDVGGISSQWSAQGQLHREVFRIVHRERGLGRAVVNFAWARSRQFAGVIVEGALLTLLGRRRGLAVVLAARRRLGFPPKLIK